jgi:hypothetical protein
VTLADPAFLAPPYWSWQLWRDVNRAFGFLVGIGAEGQRRHSQRDRLDALFAPSTGQDNFPQASCCRGSGLIGLHKAVAGSRKADNGRRGAER